ncbi:hypothetical protein BASA50_000471 [Batrachochytrium salamandrivorans]|uniref:Catalase n=1 Tax=Batrachochytrium salamandrivorans TaxID=1357716 RepID=A0ABQ8EUY8_9FUNG|nr:hypothetical protein BASA60_006492 [Batrachochytrium salamandrivorans]KAH6586517.1 hypothetical protein BASA50_000471 [Batrachochytrium salamandrivorans]KAH6602985.1 hypothetical protein BASA61_000553 [Batrachochytrium salamandrivorans]KAH9275416.1 hypothetical protein BASA83_002189 [Batrachochytrium salamandrivorans]KAJ1345109.1 hypothetical protein BSLG_000624 [Batrachochytrium salamandrivorans]
MSCPYAITGVSAPHAVAGAPNPHAAADGVGPSTIGLTNRQGHPVSDNQNSKTAGSRGPMLLQDYHFQEKLSHFVRERIPERVVHARGAGAHGFFEAYGKVGNEPIEKYTRAKLFNTAGKRTPVFTRFSTVIHSSTSPETLRDPRGFAVKFYTEDGNWDLVGNNLRIFFIRDAIKFPDMVHSLKPDPVTNIQDGNRVFDFMSNTPESTHMLTFVFSPWGIPADYRHMQGAGVNTYKWVNKEGVAHLVKYHWIPKQGVKNLKQSEANAIQGENFNHGTEDLYQAIKRGEFPEWELNVQMMTDDEHAELDFDPLDDTKLWPEAIAPMMPVGRMVLDRNPVNYFAEVEQAAFGTGVLVDGLDFSDDKMLQGRTFSYSDAQRYRVGANYLQLPINRPLAKVATNQRDGFMTFHVDGVEAGGNPHVNYEPSGRQGLMQQTDVPCKYEPVLPTGVKAACAPIDRTNPFRQAGETYRNLEDWERDDLIENLSNALAGCNADIQDRMIYNFTQADSDYGARVAQGIPMAAMKMKMKMQSMAC